MLMYYLEAKYEHHQFYITENVIGEVMYLRLTFMVMYYLEVEYVHHQFYITENMIV